ncbi:MAG: outer membrane protein assembly factor BamB family protein [Planctomycetota bacterium]
MRRALHALGAVALGAMGGLVIYTLQHQRSPDQVVLDSFEALKQTDFDRLRACYSEPAWAIVSEALPPADDAAAHERLRQYMAGLQDVHLEAMPVRDGIVELEAVIEHETGVARDVIQLVRTRGAWRIGLARTGSGTTFRPPTRPQDVEPYFDTPHARVRHSWVHRALREGATAVHLFTQSYALLAGNLEDLSAAALADLTATDANEVTKEAIIGMARALLDRPDNVSSELAQGLIHEGLRAARANDRLYHAWRSGAPLTAQDRTAYLARAGAMEKFALGRRLAADTRAHAHDPGAWEQTRRELLHRITVLERASDHYDALAVLLELDPTIDEARTHLKRYAPYQNHHAPLDALLAGVWDTVRTVSTELQAALVIAPGANMRRTGVYNTEGVRRFNQVLWKYEASDRVGGQPAVRNDTLYFATSAHFRWDSSFVYAVDLRSQKTKWRFDAPARRPSSITLLGNRLYLSCGDAGASPAYLCAIDAATGRELWTFEGPRGSQNTLSHPAVDEAGVYVADCWGALYALDAETGQEKWRFEGKAAQTKSAPTPSLADGVVYLPGVNHVYAVDAGTGAEKWNLNVPVSDGMVAVDNGTMYFYHRGVSAVSLADRQQRWRFEPRNRLGSLRGCPAVDGDMVFARDGQVVYALEAATGAQVWKFDIGRPIDWKVSPVVADGTLYIGTGAAENEEGESCLHAIDTGTGRELWRFPLDAVLYGSAPVVASGVVYFSAAELVYALD